MIPRKEPHTVMNDSYNRPAGSMPAWDGDTYTLNDPPIRVGTAPADAWENPPTDLPPVETAPADRPRNTFTRLGFSIVLLFAGTTLFQYAIAYFVMFCFPDLYSAWWMNWVLSIVPLYGVGLPLMMLMLRRTPVAPHNALYVRQNSDLTEKPRLTRVNFLLLLLMSFGFMYIGNMVGTTLMSVLEFITGYPYSNALESVVDESPLWATFLGTCVVAPIGEEFIFRKLFIDRARRHGDTAAILFSGLLFGLFHGNLYQCFYAALLGILLAYVYTRTSNLWLCVGIHGIINLMGGIITPALAKLLPDTESLDWTSMSDLPGLLSEHLPELLLGYLVLLVIGAWSNGVMATAIVLFFTRRRRSVIAPDPARRPTKEVLREAFLNPGMLVAVILLAVTILSNVIIPVVTAAG